MRRKNGVGRAARALLPAAFWLLVWQAAALAVDHKAVGAALSAGDAAALGEAFLRGKELLLPAPAAVFLALGELLITSRFWLSAGMTLLRVLGGFLLGTALGTGLAVLCAASKWLDVLVSPLVGVIRATPVASFIILLLLWVSTGRVPCVCAALMVLPVVWGSVRQGIGSADPLLLECARACRFKGWKTVRLVYIPSSLPAFSAGCATAMGLAWKAGVAAEVLCLPVFSLGAQVYYAKIYLETPALFAWTLAILALSFGVGKLFSGLFARLGRRVSL